jgi:hypothetical protein
MEVIINDSYRKFFFKICGQKEDLYVNDTKECDNMDSNTELSEKISKYRIAVNDLALVVDMKTKNTDFKEEFSVRIVYHYLHFQ